MNTRLLATLLALAAAPVALLAADAKPAEKADAIPRHPLRGVITAIVADQSALRVKHEEVPGVMHAMTMQFKVDAATLKAAVPGQVITATLVQRGEELWLEDVTPVSTK